MKTFLKLCALCVLLRRISLGLIICGCFAGSAAAQNTLVTGTFKTQEGKTPAQAGLSVKLCLLAGVLSGPTNGACTGGATALYGDATFTAHDMGAYPNQVRELTIGGIPYYPGQVHVWIKGDGTIISLDGSAGVRLLPTIGASPSGLAYCAEISFTGSAANRLSPVQLKGKNFCKNIPDQASVDWGTLAVAAVTTPAVSYQLQTNASVSGYEEWGGIATPTNPAGGLYRVFVNSSTNKLACITSTGADCNPAGGGGSSTTISIDAVNLTTQSPLNFQDTTEIDWTNPSAGNVQIALKASSVADSKLAQIVTASKVSGAAITLLTSLPAGAGNVPIANLPDFSGIGACGANTWVSTLNDNGAPTCTQPGFSNLSGAASLAQLPFGTANQLHKTNTGGTAVEQATLSIGTAGTDFAVAFAAGTITLNLPSASGTVRGALLSADWTIFNNSVDSVSGTTEEVSSSGGQTPVLSLPTVINLSGKTLKGGSPLVFEGLTADAFETTLVITDPTAARLFTLPNADSVAVQPKTCSGTDKVSDISALGVVTCTADAGGAGSGDNVTVNTVPAVDADFDDATPAAPANAVNVKWQKDALTPNNLSAHLLFSTIGTATFGANADFTWTFDNLGATDPQFQFAGGVLTLAAMTRLDTPNELRNANAAPLKVAGKDPDGASAIGVRLNAQTALTVAGSKITTFENNSVVKSYIDKDGGFSGNAVTASALAADPTGCTNQFVRDIAAAGTLTCATVTSADTSGTFPPTTTNLALLNAGNTWSTGAQSFAAATSLLVPASAGYAPTADGSVGYDTTQKATVAGGNGAVKGFFPRVLSMQNCTTSANCTSASGGNQVDANAAAQGVAETNFSSNFSMPANFLFTNKAIQVCGVFEYTSSASPPTLTIRFKAGATVLVGGTATAPNAAQSNRGFAQCYLLQGTAAAGASVSVEAGYMGLTWANLNALNNTVDQPLAGIATNGALTIQISAQWGTATTGNTIQLHQFYVMELN